MTVKIAVFAPMPSASVSTATAVKPGFFSNWRKANLRSFITQCLHRIDFCGAARREETSKQRSGDEQDWDGCKSEGISWGDPEQQAAQNPCQRDRTDQSKHDSRRGESETAPQHQGQDRFALRAQRHADTDLTRALTDRPGDDSVNAHHREKQ